MSSTYDIRQQRCVNLEAVCLEEHHAFSGRCEHSLAPLGGGTDTRAEAGMKCYGCSESMAERSVRLRPRKRTMHALGMVQRSWAPINGVSSDE